MAHRYRSAPLVALACALPLAVVTPAAADPTVGLGVSFSFGVGKPIDTGVGLRVFTNNRRNSTVGSLGIDYMFAAQEFRGTLGVAALRRNVFLGLDVGYGFGSGALDFGPSAGFVRTRSAPAPAILPPGNDLPPPGDYLVAAE